MLPTHSRFFIKGSSGVAGSWQQLQATVAKVWPNAERGDTWNNVYVKTNVGAGQQFVQVGLDVVPPDLEIVDIQAPVAEVDPVRLAEVLGEIGSLALGVVGVKRIGAAYWVTLITRLPLAMLDLDEWTTLVLVVQLFGSAAATLAERISRMAPDPWPAVREAITNHPEMRYRS